MENMIYYERGKCRDSNVDDIIGSDTGRDWRGFLIECESLLPAKCMEGLWPINQ